MNNIVKIIEYYINHNNADDSVVQYIKDKLDDCTVEDLIIIQIHFQCQQFFTKKAIKRKQKIKKIKK